MAYKITLVFSQDGYGWTESYVLNLAPTPLTTIQNIYVSTLVLRRLAILGNCTEITYSRISTIGTPFAVYLAPVNLFGTYNASSALPNVAALVRWIPFVAGPAKSWYMRGIPISLIGKCGVLVPTLPAAWQSAWASFVAFLTPLQGNVWGWWGVTSKPFVQLSGYTVSTQGVVVISTVTPTGGLPIFVNNVPGQKVQIRVQGVNGKSKLNGLWTATVLTESTCQLIDAVALLPYAYGGRLTLVGKGFIAWAFPIIERIMTRKAGRELFLEHGRAPIRIKV